MTFEFQKGLLDLGGGAHVFLSGSEAFGLANAGLVVGNGESMVIDTLYDVQHAQEMMDAIGAATANSPVRYIVNTHSDGDHIFGNQVFPDDAEIVVTEAASTQMTQEHADLTASLFDESRRPESVLHPVAALTQEFDIHPVRVRPADTTFCGEKEITVGGVEVQLHELGPAHTVGDAIAYLPAQKVLFAGDLLTRDIVKVTWSGSIPNWITALERIRAFGAEIVVAGHGPVLAGAAITAAIDLATEFWSYIHEQAMAFYDRGVPADEAAARIDVTKYPLANVTLPVLVTAVYHECNPDIPYRDLTQAFESMAEQVAKMMTPSDENSRTHG